MLSPMLALIFFPPLALNISHSPSLSMLPQGQVVSPGFPHHGLRYPTNSGEDLVRLKKKAALRINSYLV